MFSYEKGLILQLSKVTFETMHQTSIRLLAFDARFFCLSATQKAPPVGGQHAGGAFWAADKRKNRASKVNKLTFGYTANFQDATREVKG